MEGFCFLVNTPNLEAKTLRWQFTETGRGAMTHDRKVVLVQAPHSCMSLDRFLELFELRGR